MLLGIFIIVVVLIVVISIWKRGTLVVGMAVNALSKGDKEKAERLYRLADKIGGMGFDATLNCGYFFIKNGYVDEARVIFNRTAMSGKLDKLKKSEIDPNLAQIRQVLELEEDTVLIPFSAEKGTGREELLSQILKYVV